MSIKEEVNTSVIRPHLRNVCKRPLPAQVLCARICIHNKESLIAVGARDGVIRVYAFDSVSLQSSWENKTSHSSSAACAVTALAFYITDVICLIAGNDRGELIMWNVNREAKIRTLHHKYKGAICNLRVEQEHKHHVLASVAADGRLIVWDLVERKPKQVHRDTASALTSVCFSQNGKWVMTGSEDGNVRIYDMMNGVLFCTLCAPNSKTCNNEVSCTSVNGTAAGRSNGECNCEDLMEAITCVEFHPEREIVATGSGNGHICIWDWQHSVLLHHRYIAELTAIRALCFCQNRLLATSEHVMYLYTISKSFEHERVCIDWTNVSDLCYNGENDEVLVSCCCDNVVLLTGHLRLEHPLVESIDYENDIVDYKNANYNNGGNVISASNTKKCVVGCEQIVQLKQNETPENNSVKKESDTGSVKEIQENTTLTSPLISHESSTSLQTNQSAKRDVRVVDMHNKSVNRERKDVHAELVREGDATYKVLSERLEQLKMIREEWAEEPEEALQYLIGLHGDGWESIVCDFFYAIVESKLILTVDMLPTILTLFESLLRQDSNVLGTQPKLAALRVLRVLNAQLRPWIEREICQVKQLHDNEQLHEHKFQQQRRFSSLHSELQPFQGNLNTDEKHKKNINNENDKEHFSKCKNGKRIHASINKKAHNEVDNDCYIAQDVCDELALLKMREELDECTRDALELLNEPGSCQEELRHIIHDLQVLSEEKKDKPNK